MAGVYRLVRCWRKSSRRDLGCSAARVDKSAAQTLERSLFFRKESRDAVNSGPAQAKARCVPSAELAVRLRFEWQRSIGFKALEIVDAPTQTGQSKQTRGNGGVRP